MKQLTISNDEKRNASVGLQPISRKPDIKYVLPDGCDSKNIKILRGTMDTSLDALKQRYPNPVKLGEEIITSDPEVDVELFGKILNSTRKLYLNEKGEVVDNIHIKEIVKAPDGSVIEERNVEKQETNVTEEIPLRWTGNLIPKATAIRKFVFARKYQIKHVDSLTYNFLYDMAKTLAKSNSLMLMGGGPEGTEPIVLTTGGEPQRAFLEGRVDGDKYCLILHLTNLELTNVLNDED